MGISVHENSPADDQSGRLEQAGLMISEDRLVINSVTSHIVSNQPPYISDSQLAWTARRNLAGLLFESGEYKIGADKDADDRAGTIIKRLNEIEGRSVKGLRQKASAPAQNPRTGRTQTKRSK